jgi:hypothetical protein
MLKISELRVSDCGLADGEFLGIEITPAVSPLTQKESPGPAARGIDYHSKNED